MTTIMETEQLNTELQELYLVSKKWLSDLEFFESEFNFLKKCLGEIPESVEGLGELDQVATIEGKYQDLKLSMQNYLCRLEPIITEPEQILNISLVETYAQIERELAQFTGEIAAVKRAVLLMNRTQHHNNI